MLCAKNVHCWAVCRHAMAFARSLKSNKVTAAVLVLLLTGESLFDALLFKGHFHTHSHQQPRLTQLLVAVINGCVVRLPVS